MTQTNKSILITGASRGIGLQLALHYAAPGVNLILIARNNELLKKVADQCALLGANTIYKSIDVCDAISLKQFLKDTDAIMPIDLVIANAGVSTTLQKNWRPETEQTIEHAFAVNLHGTLNTITPLINNMILRKKGQIAIMSSLAGLRGLPQSPSYCASKAAISIYGESLRSWLKRYNIKVNVICPGYVKSDMSDNLAGIKPFLISSDKASKIIQRGLLNNKKCIIFPWQLNLAHKLTKLFPTILIDAILNRVETYTLNS